jgi:4-hydroxy-4-methyl-2-oxoglutarate aldolase
MQNIRQASQEILDFLRVTDTCIVSNAIETFNVRMRNEGYIQTGVKCPFPDLPPVVGYAVTGRIRTTAPPISNLYYYQNMSWWEYVASMPGPKIIVLADVDKAPGTGAFVGEIHAQISKALGCVGYVSNGAVRDTPALEALRFPCFAGSVTVSQAYGHLVEFGEAVEVGCLKINPGDLLQGDRHGVQKIPIEIAEDLPGVVEQIRAREGELIELCNQPDFSIERLAAALRR